MRRLKGKKGVEAETLMQAFGVLIAAVVILFLFHVGTSIWKFFANEQDQGTKESFKLFANKIEKLKDGNSVEHLYYIQPGYYLYGFNLDKKTYYDNLMSVRKVPLFGDITPSVDRPAACNNRPCLCICDDIDCSQKIKDCRVFDEIDYYVVENLERNRGTELTFKDSNDKNVKAHYLAVFGRKIGILMIGDDWKTRPIGVRREANVIYLSDGKHPLSRTYDQHFLDTFPSDIQDAACDKFMKCNVIACKKKDLSFATQQQFSGALGLTEQELFDLVKSLNTKCTWEIAPIVDGAPPHITTVKGCSTDEVYTLFENAITLKASQKSGSRDDIYDKTYAKTCIDTLRSVLNNQGWKETKASP